MIGFMNTSKPKQLSRVNIHDLNKTVSKVAKLGCNNKVQKLSITMIHPPCTIVIADSFEMHAGKPIPMIHAH